MTATLASGKKESRQFEAIRFGVQKDGPIGPRVVGLAHKQAHVVKRWIPTYSVHSARSTERGAWQVYKSFLIHDGPDNPLSEVYASIGCVEICNGPAGFTAFNDYLLKVSEVKGTERARRLSAIGDSGKLVIDYEAATRPPLRPW